MSKKYVFTARQGGYRLDKFLAKKIASLSRTRIKKLIKTKHVLVNKQKTKAAYQVHAGDSVTVIVPPLKPLTAKPEKIPLDIVYEDQDVLVVNKPQGMVVHPAAGHPDHTLVNALLYHTRNLASNPEGFRPGIVHRIDKDTSGLLMVAKNNLARQSLEKQLAHKTNERLYLAIVHGNFHEKKGTIDAPIGRNPIHRKKMAIVSNGKRAVTHFWVLEQFNDYSLVRCQLETGRTHQIRVHLAYIHHPVAGDPLYGPRRTLKGHGQFLHAATLGFRHPRTGKWLQFHVDVPPIFKQQLNKLRQESD